MNTHLKEPQINYMSDGPLINGEHPDPAIQSAAEFQFQAIDKKREASKSNFQVTVDLSNFNDRYSDSLGLVEKYFADQGLKISPLRVISRETLQRAYSVAGQSDDSTEQGRSINNRALVIENQEMGEIFGDDFVLGIALHEAAHSTSGEDEALIRTVKEEGNRIKIGGIAIGIHSLGKADLRTGAERNIVGDFWEEAFADLTRVRALRALGRTHDLDGETRPFETEAGVMMKGVPNESADDDDIILPAEFALLSRSIPGKNEIVTTPSNFAAYALELLDKHRPGLYDDLKEARTDAKKQRDAIQKIESIRPGLYRELRDLEYNEKDFVRGLVSTLEAIAADN